MVLLRSIWLVAPAWAVLYTSPNDLPDTTYDYVVVGAGTAGSVVANRLSEDSNVSVLVLEAGISNEIVNAANIPLLGPSLVPNTILDYNYTTVPIDGYYGRTLPYPRGRVLGGSSTVNYMAYTRGSKDDFDRYASYSGDDGWSWDGMQKFIQRHETFVPPTNKTLENAFSPSAHGSEGILAITLPAYETALDRRVLATTEELSDEFPFNEDFNDGSVLGIAWSPATIDSNNRRSSAATAYLGPSFMSRPNLNVLIGATASKLLQTATINDVPSFQKVEFKTDVDSETVTVSARKEIVLSGGTIGTPMLLMLSGIGDKEELKEIGIDVIVDNPSVGKNLTDHPLLASVYEVYGNDSFDNVLREDNLPKAIESWTENGSGSLADGVCNHIGFLRLPDNSSIFEDFEDASAGPNAAHIEVLISNLWVQPGVPTPEKGSFMTLTTTVLSPTSRGWMKLNSSDPFAKPLINPNYLNTEWDLLVLRESIKIIQRFVKASAWDDYIIGPFGPFAQAIDDESIEAYIRNTSATFFHPLSTAMMSPKGADWGVVDPDLKVKGVEGLRIVDGSVLPFLANGHTQAPIYLFAERGADLIKAGTTDVDAAAVEATDSSVILSASALYATISFLLLVYKLLVAIELHYY